MGRESDAHRLSEAGELVDGFAAGGDGRQQRTDFEVGDGVGLAGQDRFERVASLLAREGTALLDDLLDLGLQCGHAVNSS